MKYVIERCGLYVAGVVRRAGSRSHATSITPSVKTLAIDISGGQVQDVVILEHLSATIGDKTPPQRFRSHDYISDQGRLYDRTRAS